MKSYNSIGRKIFVVFNYLFLTTFAVLCLMPFINVLAISFSDQAYVMAGKVTFLPVGFNTNSYKYILGDKRYLASILVTVKRVALGVALQLFFAVIVAYPLSKEARQFKRRTFYSWIIVFTMIFSGGLIPTYMVVMRLGLIDKLWALVLPGAVNAYFVVLLLNFFRALPKELEDAAFIDGAGYLRALFSVYIPISTPGIATIALFSAVNHWNAWFDGLIYMNRPENYPLQSYLYTVIVQYDVGLLQNIDLEKIVEMSQRTQKAAMIFVGTLPILCVYPLLQKYFAKGIVLGSVKG